MGACIIQAEYGYSDDEITLQSTEKKPRTYRNKAHKDSLKYMRSRKHTEKKTREAIRKQIQYLRRDLSAIDAMLQSGLKLSPKQQSRLETLQKIYEQQKYMYDNLLSVPFLPSDCFLSDSCLPVD